MSKILHKTWWGEAFVNSLEAFIDYGRLSRGKSYRTDHRILKFAMNENNIEATVRGNANPYFGVTKEPKYKVSLTFQRITNVDWTSIIACICKNPGWLSKLMLNEIPDDIEKAFDNISLLPKRFDDIRATCSCPDYANPCKHIAGVYYRIANLLDGNPMLLFELHGLPLKSLKQKLKADELGAAFAEHLEQPEQLTLAASTSRYSPVKTKQKPTIKKLTIADIWEQKPIDIDFNQESGEPIGAALIKKQGDYPEFWAKHGSFVQAMEGIYNYAKIKNRKIIF